jgi:hypothetical protein
MQNKTKFIIGFTVGLLVILIGVGLITYYAYFKEKPADIQEKQAASENNNIQPATTEEPVIERGVDVKEEEIITIDTDKDGLTDIEEEKYKTDPNNKDTDNDGYTDYEEIESGYDPLNKKAEGETKEDASTTTPDTSTTVPKSPDPLSIKYVFFIHHSTGEIYWEGGLEKALSDHNYEGYAPWWDGPTDPPDFYVEFSDPEKWNIITRENMPEGQERNIIIFKSCFPSSNIENDFMLEDYKNYYRQLFEIYAAHPDKVFVPMSTPPLLEANTSYDAAQRANQFEFWLSVNYVAEYEKFLESQGKPIFKNLAPFQLHSILSDENGYLADKFQADPYDDHPNNYSGEVVGEAMWPHLNKAIIDAGLAN